MKFLPYFSCFSIVWSIAFAGCGSKYNQNMPHDAIPLQAKVNAESDAKHDANALAYLGAGMSAPLATGTCCLMAAGTGIVLIDDENAVFLLPICALVPSAAVLSLTITDHSPPPNPPPERLIGKSPEYIKSYADAYHSKMRSYRKRAVAVGSIVGCTAMTVVVAVLIHNIYNSRNDYDRLH